MERSKHKVPQTSARRLGLSRRIRGNVLTSTLSTPNSNQKDDVSTNSEKLETSVTPATLVNSVTSVTPATPVSVAPVTFVTSTVLKQRTSKILIGDNKHDKTSTTPRVTNLKNPSTLSQSTSSRETPASSKNNHLKLKLSLCKAPSESLSRKRMQYLKSESLIQPKRLKLDESQLRNDSMSITQSPIVSCDSSDKLPVNDTEVDAAYLTNAIAELKSTIENLKRHEQRSSELLRLISKWREAGQRAIAELQLKIEPKQDIKVILDHFKIDPNIFHTT